MDKQIIHKKNTPTKKRSQSAYNNKVDKLTNWYNHLLKCREKEVINPNNKCPVKRKELKPLEYYIGLLKQVKGDN
jgi:hypothetical protein